MDTYEERYGMHISAGDLLKGSMIGRRVRFVGDESMIFMGIRQHSDGKNGHFMVELDSRWIEAWDFDDVWLLGE